MQFRQITEQIEVEVFPEYIPESELIQYGIRSNTVGSRYFFAYTVRMKNLGHKKVKLLSRHWIITNAIGEVEEVRGEGVIGEYPTLEPGQVFEYTSFCPLTTRSGSMRGDYTFLDLSDDHKSILESPHLAVIEDLPSKGHATSVTITEDGRLFDVKIPTFLLRDQGEGTVN